MINLRNKQHTKILKLSSKKNGQRILDSFYAIYINKFALWSENYII